MKKTLLICTLVFISLWSFGQSNCETNLDDARVRYINGDFDGVIALLSACTGLLQRAQDNLEAYELLINSYQMKNQQVEADQLAKTMLKEYPLYQPKQTALLPYKRLFESYKIQRRFGLRITAGTNQPVFQVMQYRSYGGIVEETEGYSSKSGFSGGVLLDYYLFETLAITTGLSIQNSEYAQSETIMGFQKLDVEENLTYFKIPLLLSPSLKLSKWEIILAGGMNMHLLYSSRVNMELYGLAQDFPNPLTGISRKAEGYDMAFQRKQTTFNYQAGVSVARNIGLFRVELCGTYEHGINNLINASSRYENRELIGTYSYIPDDVKMNNTQFMIGLTRFFVYPKKMVK